VPDVVLDYVEEWLELHGRDDLAPGPFLELARRFVSGATIGDLNLALTIVLKAVNAKSPRTRVPFWVKTLASMTEEHDRVRRWFGVADGVDAQVHGETYAPVDPRAVTHRRELRGPFGRVPSFADERAEWARDLL